jgi:hypothetical protein
VGQTVPNLVPQDPVLARRADGDTVVALMQGTMMTVRDRAGMSD